jgi:hypothetical protein
MLDLRQSAPISLVFRWPSSSRRLAMANNPLRAGPAAAANTDPRICGDKLTAVLRTCRIFGANVGPVGSNSLPGIDRINGTISGEVSATFARPPPAKAFAWLASATLRNFRLGDRTQGLRMHPRAVDAHLDKNEGLLSHVQVGETKILLRWRDLTHPKKAVPGAKRGRPRTNRLHLFEGEPTLGFNINPDTGRPYSLLRTLPKSSILGLRLGDDAGLAAHPRRMAKSLRTPTPVNPLIISNC